MKLSADALCGITPTPAASAASGSRVVRLSWERLAGARVRRTASTAAAAPAAAILHAHRGGEPHPEVGAHALGSRARNRLSKIVSEDGTIPRPVTRLRYDSFTEIVQETSLNVFIVDV